MEFLLNNMGNWQKRNSGGKVGRIYKQMHAQMYKWTNKWMNKWMNKQTNNGIKVPDFFFAAAPNKRIILGNNSRNLYSLEQIGGFISRPWTIRSQQFHCPALHNCEICWLGFLPKSLHLNPIIFYEPKYRSAVHLESLPFPPSHDSIISFGAISIANHLKLLKLSGLRLAS